VLPALVAVVSNSTDWTVGSPTLLALERVGSSAHLGEWPPPQYAKDYYAWWSHVFGRLVPNEVCDACGGLPGFTPWERISEKCGLWSMTMLRCLQICNGQNRWNGFGVCMKTCGVTAPDCSFCEEDHLPANVTNYCSMTCKRFKEAKCTSDTTMKTSDDFVNCLHTKVFTCEGALQRELKIAGELSNYNYTISWRARKCPRQLFACGADGSAVNKCSPMKWCENPFDAGCVESECKFPIGAGQKECYFDDPFCGGRKKFPEMKTEDSGLVDMCGVTTTTTTTSLPPEPKEEALLAAARHLRRGMN